jgi:hypothetical protein
VYEYTGAHEQTDRLKAILSVRPCTRTLCANSQANAEGKAVPGTLSAMRRLIAGGPARTGPSVGNVSAWSSESVSAVARELLASSTVRQGPTISF